MNSQQQRRVQILTRLCSGAIDTTTACQLLGLSHRQLRREFEQQGIACIPHGSQGRVPSNHTNPAVIDAIAALAGPQGVYHDFNVCHLQEKLAQEEGITIGRSTLDRLLKEQGLRPRHKPRQKPIRRRRPPRSAEGMLLQMDGSFHDWLEGRGPKMCLLGAIDDATGKIIHALFRPTEDLIGYLLLLRGIVLTHGLPMGIYHDRHTILRSPKEATIDDELAGRPPMSQVQRVLEELGIESIVAHSAPAKGRVERLWGTLQDRLVKEMRLRQINTGEAANDFLADFISGFNACFGKSPADLHAAWEPVTLDTSYFFARKEWRVVAADHTVRFQAQTLQIVRDKGQPSIAGKRVAVHVVPEGQVYLYQGKCVLPHVPASSLLPAAVAVSPTGNEAVVQRGSGKATAKQRAWLYGQP